MSDEVGTSGNWNLPNVLTGIRILIVPFYGIALLQDGGDSILWRSVAAVLFFVAMVTDKVDGDIARARGLVTNFGKIADPIADKAMTGMAFIGLSIVGDIWWWVTILVLLREWTVTLLRLSILRKVVVAAAQSGKVKTVLQAVALTALSLPLLLLHPPLHDVGCGALLRLPGRPGGRRGDDDVVRLRVLPRRVAPAAGAAHLLTRGFARRSRERHRPVAAQGVRRTRVTRTTPVGSPGSLGSRKDPPLHATRLSRAHSTRALGLGRPRRRRGRPGIGVSPGRANTAGTGLVISEVYGAGGNGGATYNADFVELYNPTAAAISVANDYVHYRSAAGGSGGTPAPLTGSVPADGHYLIQMSAASATNGIASADARRRPVRRSTWRPPVGQIFLLYGPTPIATSRRHEGCRPRHRHGGRDRVHLVRDCRHRFADHDQLAATAATPVSTPTTTRWTSPSRRRTRRTPPRQRRDSHADRADHRRDPGDR